MKRLHYSNVHNIENDIIIQLCEYSKRPPGHMVFVGIEKISQNWSLKSKAIGQRFL
jgi:hypothetical protein